MALIDGIWLSPSMVQSVANELGVHRTTVARWMKAGKLPPWARRLLDITHNGNLSAIHDDWHGWRMNTRNGDLVTPVGTTVTTGVIMSYPYNAQLVTSLRRRMRELESELVEADTGTDACLRSLRS